MVQTHQVEKKTPLTILETNIDGKSAQFVVESDTPLETCLKAINEFEIHIEKILEELQEKQENPIESLED